MTSTATTATDQAQAPGQDPRRSQRRQRRGVVRLDRLRDVLDLLRDPDLLRRERVRSRSSAPSRRTRVAFFFRPLGGMLLGRYADLRGRKQAMLLTIALMAGGSFVIAVLPTFNQVGWLAPILLLVARIAQGMSLGGEVSNASAYLAEIAPARAPRPLLVVLLHLHRHGGPHRVPARCAAGQQPVRRPARDLGLAGSVRDRWPARPGRSVAAQGHGRDRAVRGEQGQGAGTEEPADAHPARAPARGRPADRLHAALHALLLHVLLGAHAVRRRAAEARRRHGLLGAVDRHRAVRGAAVPVRLDRRPLRPQAADARLVGAHRAADRPDVEADRAGCVRSGRCCWCSASGSASTRSSRRSLPRS